MRIAYFVHDLSDPAVARRVRMLLAGGAEVIVLGFRRSEQIVREIAGVNAVDLGRTFDARMGHRTCQTLRQCFRGGVLRQKIADCDVIIARNLEMLAVANAARSMRPKRQALVYESLDIHRLLLGNKLLGRALRAIERVLLMGCDLLIVSSPAFLKYHFDRYGCGVKTMVLENKLFQLTPAPRQNRKLLPSAPPWKIGWFGMIRCSKSLALLKALVEKSDGAVEVVIRGRPAYTEFDDFDATIAITTGMTFEGPYLAEDLPGAYQDVHFCWAIDYFEEGLNSQWLLPNRLYEGSYYGAVPLVEAECEIGRWMADRGAGVVLEQPSQDLGPFFETLTSRRYEILADEVAMLPGEALIATLDDCVQLVAELDRDKGASPF